MNKKELKVETFIDDLRKLLVKHTGGCVIQDGKYSEGWPCGTCVCHLLGKILDEKAPEYHDHNEQTDRVNEVWRAILQIRDYQKIDEKNKNIS